MISIKAPPRRHRVPGLARFDNLHCPGDISKPRVNSHAMKWIIHVP
jgi:hypothetical protein